LCGIHNIL